MLSWLRNNAKIFLIAIIVIFVVMIFVDWGRGRASASRADRFAIARINDKNMLPEQYDAARSHVYAFLENQMKSVGDPAPENQLALMYNEINEMAFQQMIDEELQEDYLKSIDWTMTGLQQAEALLLSQMRLSGIPDPEEYLKQYKSDPSYNMMIYQLIMQANERRFQAAVSLENMVSREEVEFTLMENYTPVTARYLTFRELPEIPDEAMLEVFYEQNPYLFTDSPHCTLRYVTVLVQPRSEDEERTLRTVDSLALSGTAQADTIMLTKDQFLSFSGWNIDLEPGDFSEPFMGVSLLRTGFLSGHMVKLLSDSNTSFDSISTGGDTLSLLHWEVPVLPGYQTLRNTFWDVEEVTDDLLAEIPPWSDSLLIVDWGELYIDENTITGTEIPLSLKTFALDSIWADSTGPVFYLPSYRGGFPALITARKIETSEGGLLSYEEAEFSGRLLLEAYTELQQEASVIAALEAREFIINTGLSLGMYAESESITINTTPEFTVSSIRNAALNDPEGHMGVLSCPEFADVVLIAPELQVIGPFVSGGLAYLVEITTRQTPQFPDDPSALAPVYLSTQQQHGFRAIAGTTEQLREHSEITDLREQYYTMIDSLRAAQPQP